MTIDPDTLEELVTAPKVTQTQEGRVEERSVDELIKADQYTRTAAASDAVPWGIRTARLRPGSTTE